MAQPQTDHYFVPTHSKAPIMASVALFTLMIGVASWLNGLGWGKWVFFTGVAAMLAVLFYWFSEVVRESLAGHYNRQVDVSFRMGMIWFIFSEVMFFAAFFGALFYIRVLSVPDLASLEHKATLWPDFKAAWPSAGPGFEEKFSPMGAWGLPAINTFLLLTSGVTVTIAHWALKEGRRGILNLFLFFTVALGVIFLGVQAYEYGHAYADLNLKLTTGAYGSTFFMLTGFHGFHVTVGAIMLSVIFARCVKGHFKPDHHFAFEGVAWYWHFVDVVWLGLFIFVYWL